MDDDAPLFAQAGGRWASLTDCCVRNVGVEICERWMRVVRRHDFSLRVRKCLRAFCLESTPPHVEESCVSQLAPLGDVPVHRPPFPTCEWTTVWVRMALATALLTAARGRASMELAVSSFESERAY